MENNQFSNVTNHPCVLPEDITERQWDIYYVTVWWLEGLGAVMLGFFGIFLNLTTIFCLVGSDLASSFFNWLLVSLSVFDSLLLGNGILEAFRNHLGSHTVHNYVFVVFLYPFRSIVMCCSIYTTVVLALERYNALVKPKPHNFTRLRLGKQSLQNYFRFHFQRLLKYIGPIVILSTVYSIPRWLEIDVENQEICDKIDTNQNNSHNSGDNTAITCKTTYEIVINRLRSNDIYILWYLNIANLIITTIIPLITLIYLNANIYKRFKEFLKRHEVSLTSATAQTQEKIKKKEKDMTQQTMILFSIVFLFGGFHILRIVLNVEEFLYFDERKQAKQIGCEWLQYWTIIASPISHFLLQINSSVNFVIYCYFNKSFRSETASTFSSAIAMISMKPNNRRTFANNDEAEMIKSGEPSAQENFELNLINVVVQN